MDVNLTTLKCLIHSTTWPVCGYSWSRTPSFPLDRPLDLLSARPGVSFRAVPLEPPAALPGVSSHPRHFRLAAECLTTPLQRR